MLSRIVRPTAVRAPVRVFSSAPFDDNMLSFDDPETSFKGLSTYHIIRASVVFKLCQSKILVDNAGELINLSKTVFGNTFTAFVLRHTFFAHFCAGESDSEVLATTEALKDRGIRSILDFAAEPDTEAAASAETAEAAKSPLYVDASSLQGRFHTYEGEDTCDANMEHALRAVEQAKAGQGFAAIKLTALGDLKTLQFVSQVINECWGIVADIASNDAPQPNPKDATLMPFSPMPLSVARDDFVNHSVKYGFIDTPEEANAVFTDIDVNGDGTIDFVEWTDYIHVKRLAGLTADSTSWILPAGVKAGFQNGALSEEQLDRFESMLERTRTIAKEAAAAGVSIMIDAEQSCFQPAIDHIALSLQREFNTADQATIYNTYQAYLVDTEKRLLLGFQKANRHGFKFGVKLVRGAYLLQERSRAEALDYVSPIWKTKGETDECYSKCSRILMDNIDQCEFIAATHNMHSVREITRLMAEKGIANDDPRINFGQLLGMCDYVSTPLGSAGYNVFKYIPYGPVLDVVPYLVRRAQENSAGLDEDVGLMAGVTHERELLEKEIVRRLY